MNRRFGYEIRGKPGSGTEGANQHRFQKRNYCLCQYGWRRHPDRCGPGRLGYRRRGYRSRDGENREYDPRRDQA